MENNYYYEEFRIVNCKEEGRCLFFYLENGERRKRKELAKPYFFVECSECKKKCSIDYYNGLRHRKYLCTTCNKKGERNKMYGKKHSDASKEKMRNSTLGKYDGEKNPFYGKKHTKKSREAISKKLTGKFLGENGPFYGRHHTEENKKLSSERGKNRFREMSEKDLKKLRKKMSDGQKRIFKEDPETYRKNKQKAAKASQMSLKRYKKNQLEKDIQKKMEEMGIFLEYSVILGYHQYDFGHKEKRILLEIQGDYWHGNPRLYNKKGTKGKRKLNDIQKSNMKNDTVKKDFADKHELKIFYLWECDFRGGDYSILEKIKNEIQTN
jgi:G:T-mismatch repair DNA endonuclease (very short patch repair protein)